MKQLLKKSIISITIAITFLIMNKFVVMASTQEKILDFTIDPVWSKLYGGRSSDELRSLAPTSDGGFVGAGYTYDGASMGGTSYGDYDGLLVKYNKYGEPEFSTEYGGNLADTFYSINQTSDGGYITCGYTQSTKSGTITTDLLGDDDGLLVKFSPTGSVEWERRFGTTGAKWQNYTSCRNITENHDGTYTMVGYHFGNNNGDILDPNNGQRDGYISKVAKNGDIMWTQVFGGSANDSFNAAYELPDGSFIVAGQSQSSNSGEITATNKGNYDALLAKFDKDGNPIWNRLYGGSGSENFEALSVNSDGEVVVVGSTNSQNGDFLTDGNVAYGGVDGLVGKFDAAGRVMWHKTIGGAGSDYVYSVIDTNEDKYLLSGTSTSSNSGIITDVNSGATDGLVIAINEDGTLDWNHLFGGSGNDTFEDSVAVDNGSGYVVGGYSSSSNSGTINDSNSGEDDTLLVKFSTNNIPTLVVPPFVELNVGDTYDPLLDVSAEDYEDGDVTSDIKVTNNVDTNVPGVYITDYSVKDLERNESTEQQIVLINDGSFAYNDEYIMHADDVTHKIAQVQTDDASILSQADVKVFDKLTGLEITDPVITVDKGDYQAANGVYPITFTYNGASITSTFTVDNGEVPVITSDSFFTINPGETFDTASKISATDGEDGPITTYDIDDSKLNNNLPGSYPIEIKVVDSDGNETKKTIVVAVIDETATITDDFIFYNVDYSQRVGQYTLDKDYHLTNGSVRVYSKTTGLLIDNSDIMIRFNDYQQKAGVYNVDFFVKDILDQFATSEVTVVAGDSPIITGPDYLEVNQGEPYTDPYGGISISDKEDDVIANSEMTSDITIDTNKPGVYIITYTVVDSDLNQDTFTQTVVVKNDKMVIDDNYIIYAEDYQLRVGQVTHDAADIASLSKLQVYDKATDTLLDPSDATIDSSALKAEPGTYPVTITIDGLVRTINVKVVTGQAPTITGDSYFEIDKGTTTDFTTSLDVDDKEDTDLSTDDLTVTGTVDKDTPGVYELEYKVTDSDGNDDIFKQQVVVKDDNTTINDQYVIFGNDYQIYVRQVDQTTAQIIERGNIKVYDKANRTYVDNTSVDFDDSAIEAAAGVYPLTVSYNGLSHQINVTVISGKKPVISGANNVELDKGTAFDPLAGVTLSDEEDTDLTPDMITIDGTVDKDTPGVYNLVYSYTDSDNNTTTVNRTVIIKSDNMINNETYIIFADNVNHKFADVRTDDPSIIADAHVKVYDKVTGLEITNPVITVDKGDYQAANGVYPITFTYDGYTITSTFTVDNGEVPVITSDSFFTSNLGDTFDTASNVTVTDEEDGPITTYDIDDSKLDTDKLGVYPVDINVVDSDGNTAEKTIIVAVINDTATITDDYVFYNVDYSQRVGQYTLDKDYHLTNSGIKVYSKATGQLIDNSDIMIRFNDYQQKVGVYNVDFFVKDTLDQFVTSEVTVVKGDSPIITGPEYLEVNQGEPYTDPYGGISISDKEDDVIANSEMTSDITIDTNKPGVYIITYTVVDSDFNQDTFTQTVIVKNDKMVIDDNYIIYAEDYQLRVGQVTHDAADITKYSKLQVYDKATNTLLDTSDATIDSSALKAEPGTYPVTITIGDLQRTINVTVVTGQAPTITGNTYIEVNNGSSTDFTTSLEVNDKEDTDLSTADLTVNGTVDVMTPGVYELEYKVTDSDGNEDTFKQQIVVKSDNTTINNQYVIFGNDYEIYVSQVAQTTAQIIERSDLKIYDKVNRTYIDNPTVNIDDSAVKAKAGVYPLYVTYDGLRHQINVTVISGKKPVISGADYTEVDKGTSFDPLAGITLSDEEDKDLTPDMITVTGTVDTSKPGVYNLVYSYTDSDNNTTTVNRMVVVKDQNMVINNNYIIYAHDYSTTVSALDLSNKNVIKLSGLTVYNKIANEYVTNPNVVIDTSKVKPIDGVYPVKITYLGLDRTINVTVIGGEKPVISGEEFSVIAQGSHFNPLLGMEVTDKEDGPINPTALKVSGTVDTSKPGVYKLVYSYVDRDNNKTSFSREVVVSNKDTQINDDYVIYAHDYSTYVSNASTASNFILNNSEGYVYSRNTKEYLTLNQIDIDRGLLENKPGIYEVKIGKDETFKSITVTVSAGTKPQINIADQVVEANTGDKLNIEDLITYQDLETPYSKLVETYETDYNPNKVGVYEVNYTVTDLDGNVQTAKLKIFVNDGSYVTNNKNALSATDVTYNLSNEQSLEQYIIENANIHAYDFNSGTEMDLSNLKINLKNVKNKPGTYEVYLSLNGLTKTINVTITKDDENNSEVTSEENSEHNSEVTSEENSEHNSEVTSEQSSEASKLQITGNRLYLINILILCAASLCLIIIKRQLS